MNELALDPSETRPSRSAVRHAASEPMAPAAASAPGRAAGRARLLIGGACLGIAGLGAFAAATTLLSGLAGPSAVRRPIAPMAQQSAADWPDLKDGQPALAAGAPRVIASDGPATEPKAAQPATVIVAPANTSPTTATLATLAPAPTAPAAIRGEPPKIDPAPSAKAETAPTPASRPAPALVEAPVVGPVRQVGVLPPGRPVPVVAARPAETVRARTASTAFAALPPEPAAREASRPTEAAPARDTAQDAKASRPKAASPAGKPEGKDPAKEAAKPKPKAVAARKEAAPPGAVAQATPPAEPEETEVLGIRMPTLSAAGRKIGASVEALGDAVKSLPDRF